MVNFNETENAGTVILAEIQTRQHETNRDAISNLWSWQSLINGLSVFPCLEPCISTVWVSIVLPDRCQDLVFVSHPLFLYRDLSKTCPFVFWALFELNGSKMCLARGIGLL